MDVLLPQGIFPTLETPFAESGELDVASLEALTEDAIANGSRGLLAPLVASEVHALQPSEQTLIIETVMRTIAGRAQFVAGASSSDPESCRFFARLAERLGCTAYLVAVPPALYEMPAAIPDFFESIACASKTPLIIQDLQWNGPGLDIDLIGRLHDRLPTLVGLKIETVPAGPKFTRIREALGRKLHISGGWSIPQLIEALDRRVDAMVSESALVPVLNAVCEAYFRGRREDAVQIFRRVLPVLAFSNQEIFHSIAFFKRLLVKKGLLRSATMRAPGYQWDRYNLRIADELIDYYLALESEVRTLAGIPRQ